MESISNHIGARGATAEKGAYLPAAKEKDWDINDREGDDSK